MPLQFFSLLGICLSFGSAALFVLLLIRRFVMGAEVQGVFTLFAITFFLMGVILFGIGLLGEYIGRIYLQVRARPRYVVQALLQAGDVPQAQPGIAGSPGDLAAGLQSASEAEARQLGDTA